MDDLEKVRRDDSHRARPRLRRTMQLQMTRPHTPMWKISRSTSSLARTTRTAKSAHQSTWHTHRRATARTFVAASQFLELLNVFGPLDAEVRRVLTQTQSKVKYAKWKAAQISKAIRQGEKPPAGPAMSEEEHVLAQLLPPTDGAAAEDVRPDGVSNERAPSDEAPSASDAPERPSTPPSKVPALPSAPTSATHDADTARAPAHGPPSTSDAPSLPSTPHTELHNAQSSEPSHLPSVPSETAQPSPVQVMAAATPSAPSVRAPQAPPTAPPPPPSDSGLSVTEIARIQKLSRWACSALDYEDVETARTHLQDALRLLDGARSSHV